MHPATADRRRAPSNSDELQPPNGSNHLVSKRSDELAVQVNHVSKTFRSGTAGPKTLKERLMGGRSTNHLFKALNDVSFDVKQGETFGIIGHNGSGKSTLLKIMAGIMRPTDGEVLVQGRLAALLELGAGFHPELSGAENIHLNGTILGLHEDEVEASFQDIVDFAEIEDFIHSPVKHYSSGMRARLGFSVATHLDPDVLLIDEVLSVGDERFRQKCMERVHRFRAMGRTLILVSHSASMVAQLCKRSAVLFRGELIYVGNSDDAIAVYRAALAEEGEQPESEPTAESPDIRAIGIRAATIVGHDPDPTFEPGATVTVGINLEVVEPTDCRVRVTVKSEDGMVLVNQASTPLLGRVLTLDPGPATVEFTLHGLPLRDGKYFVDVIAESPDGRDTFHRAGRACTFNVQTANRHLGLLAVEMSCKLVADTPTQETPATETVTT